MTDRYIEPAVQRLLNVIGLSGEYRAGSVRLVGEDPVVPSRSRLGLASAAALAAQGAAIATIWHEMTGEKQDVRVDVRQAANPGLRTCAVLRQNGHTLRQPGPPDEENNFFITRDGRRIYLLRTSLQQKHRGRLLAFLGCSDGTTSALAEAVRHWDSLELEDALADQKLIGVIARPRAEWLSHPQGQWLNSRPPVSIEKIAESEPEPFSRTARPLSGLRVLDMAHVLAGPICSRVLAEQGADVLHVSSPHDRDASYIELDTMFGKRASYIDLNRASDETRLWELIKSCDVFAHSWRPGSLERRGLSMERMAACRPGIIFVSVSCYGYGGPWMTRGGYEPLGQTACGLVLDEGAMDEPLLAPTYTLNDYLAGYLAAAGVLGALIRRAHEGGSYHVHVSLTRCSMWVQELGLLEQNKWPTREARSKLPELRESDLMSTETVFGMVDHAAPITHYSNSRAYWARPPAPPRRESSQLAPEVIRMKVIAKAVGVAFVSAALLQGASGQDSTFPNRPISIVVPYTPGGISDGVTREFARFLSEELHQPVLVLNKPGAGGIVGTEFVAAAKGDGYTLLYGAPGPILINPSLQKKLSYDPMRSFAPVHGFFDSPMILLANAARPYKSVEQLIEYARRNPGAINYGSPGIGTTPHLAAEALRRAAKIDLVHIAYKGAPMADLVAGVIDIAFNYSVGSAPLIEAGKIVPLAVTGSQRMSTFPDVPTFKELGLDAVTVTGPSVILAPSSTPEEILSKLEIATNAALAKPALKKFVEADGSVVMSDLRRSAARDYMKQQIEHFGRLIQDSGITPE